MRKFALAGILVLIPLTAARADIIPMNNTITGGPDYTWDYTIQITSDQTAYSGPAPTVTPVQQNSGSGAFWTLYDFVGYVAGTCSAPSGWTCTAQNIGYTPSNVTPTSPPDSSAIVNLTFSYTSGAALVGPQSLAGFSAESTSNLITQGSFTARATKNTGASTGTLVDNVGNVNIPTSSSGVPEPASIALLGMALAYLGIFRRPRLKV